MPVYKMFIKQNMGSATYAAFFHHGDTMAIQLKLCNNKIVRNFCIRGCDNKEYRAERAIFSPYAGYINS